MLTHRLVMAAAALLLTASVPTSGTSLVTAREAFPQAEDERLGLPYVYTDWQQFTVADGLPNDQTRPLST